MKGGLIGKIMREIGTEGLPDSAVNCIPQGLNSQAAEQAFLNDLAGRFRFNHPFQEWTVNQCANAVVIVADIAFTWLEPELPAGVTCRSI
jgi:hypothetical protein